MDTRYQFIHFAQYKTSAKTKTTQWECLNNRSNSLLGIVEWYGPWRQYCFMPEADCVFNNSCLADIQHFIGQLMDTRKGELVK